MSGDTIAISYSPIKKAYSGSAESRNWEALSNFYFPGAWTCSPVYFSGVLPLRSVLASDCPGQNSAWAGQAEFVIPKFFSSDWRQEGTCSAGGGGNFCMLILCSMKRSGLLHPNQPQRQRTGIKESIEKRGLLLSGSTSPKGKRSLELAPQGSDGLVSMGQIQF